MVSTGITSCLSRQFTEEETPRRAVTAMELAGSWLISVGGGDWSSSAALQRLPALQPASPGVFFLVTAKRKGPSPSGQSLFQALAPGSANVRPGRQVTRWGPESGCAVLQRRLAPRAGVGEARTWSRLRSPCLGSLPLCTPGPGLGGMTCFVQASEIVAYEKTASLMVVH